jgi:hypothetical protein
VLDEVEGRSLSGWDSIGEVEFHANSDLLQDDGDDGMSISGLACQDLTLNVPRRGRAVLGCRDGEECQREFHLEDLRWMMYLNNELYNASLNLDDSVVDDDGRSNRGFGHDADYIIQSI